jgi:hypothetical protein
MEKTPGKVSLQIPQERIFFLRGNKKTIQLFFTNHLRILNFSSTNRTI